MARKKKQKKESALAIIWEGIAPKEYNETRSSLLGDILYILFLIVSFPFAVIWDIMKRS